MSRLLRSEIGELFGGDVGLNALGHFKKEFTVGLNELVCSPRLIKQGCGYPKVGEEELK